MNTLLSRIPNKYWAYFALTIWGALSFSIFNKTPYGIDEGAARALLFVWSVVDNVVSPIVTSGIPDFRTVFLVPTGFLWTGNVLAAKIATILVMSGAVWSIHAWRQTSGNAESALLASGLLLISPLVIDQIDTISVAPFLLITFALGAWSDKIYRESPLVFGGMFFAQMFLCMISITLHPAGLAYPLALLWTWYKMPVGKQKNYFFGAVIFSVLFALLLTWGWHNIEWFTNPIRSLSSLFLGSTSSTQLGTLRWMTGIVATLILVLVIWKQASNLWADLLGRIFLAALAFGILTGDETWGLIALTVCLYWGFPLLLKIRSNSSAGLFGQRGITLSLLVILSTAFMLVDKAHYQNALAGELTPRDSLIKSLAENIEGISKEESTKPLLIASQWPGLTMLACRCGAIPLPPPAKDEQALLGMLRGINYLIFDPSDPRNASLSRNLAVMSGGQVETVALQEGGVIVEIKAPLTSKAEK
jgi:hypothetical protein